MEIEKLIKLEDFCNKKIIYSDEVLEALLNLGLTPINNIDKTITGEIIYSLWIDEYSRLGYMSRRKGLSIGREAEAVNDLYSEFHMDSAHIDEMHYSKELGFYVEVEDD